MSEKPYQTKIWVKVLAFWGIFLLFYGLYKVFPVFPLSIFCGTDESNFQHYKATFFALGLLDVIEYLVYRKRIRNKSAFWYSRLTAILFAPWVVFLLWYIAPAIYGQMPTVWLEIVYANVMTILAGFMILTFETNFEKIQFSRNLKIIIWVLFIVSIFLFMIFTFVKLPWADVFIEPQWRESAFYLWRQHV